MSAIRRGVALFSRGETSSVLDLTGCVRLLELLLLQLLLLMLEYEGRCGRRCSAAMAAGLSCAKEARRRILHASLSIGSRRLEYLSTLAGSCCSCCWRCGGPASERRASCRWGPMVLRCAAQGNGMAVTGIE